jgi:hypothetical protein
MAADIDPRFLTEVPENVEVRKLDIREDDIRLSVTTWFTVGLCWGICPTQQPCLLGWSARYARAGCSSPRRATMA